MPRKSKARRSAEAAFRKLYAQLPPLECQKLCGNSCGAAPMSEFEQLVLLERVGNALIAMPAMDASVCMSCPLLTPDKLCGVYEDRPMICRQWGLVDHELMRCPFGCRPSRYLSEQESRALLRKADEISRRYFTESETSDGDP